MSTMINQTMEKAGKRNNKAGYGKKIRSLII
jgi:hypothetical protein